MGIAGVVHYSIITSELVRWVACLLLFGSIHPCRIIDALTPTKFHEVFLRHNIINRESSMQEDMQLLLSILPVSRITLPRIGNVAP